MQVGSCWYDIGGQRSHPSRGDIEREQDLGTDGLYWSVVFLEVLQFEAWIAVSRQMYRDARAGNWFRFLEAHKTFHNYINNYAGSVNKIRDLLFLCLIFRCRLRFSLILTKSSSISRFGRKNLINFIYRLNMTRPAPNRMWLWTLKARRVDVVDDHVIGIL